MSWVSIAAIFFIVWWVVLFAMLPVGLRTQDDEKEVTLGTVSSAPRGPHMLKVVVRTTIVSALFFGAFYVLTNVLGYSIENIPSFVPHFDL
jgi:predicted secreted protein